MLPRSLGNDHHSTAPLCHSVMQRLNQPAGPLQLEMDLGNQHKIHIAPRQGRVTRDEPGIAPHQLQQPDPIDRPSCLHVSRAHRLNGHRKRRFKAEALVQIHDIVVDSLRNPHDRLPQPPALTFSRQGRSTSQRPIPSHHKQNVDVHLLEQIHHFPNILLTAGSSQYRTAKVMNLRHGFRTQSHWRQTIPRNHPLIPVTETKSTGHAVPRVALGNDSTHDVIEPGAQPTASDYRGGGFTRIKEEILPRTGQFEANFAIVLCARSRRATFIAQMVKQNTFGVRAEGDLER